MGFALADNGELERAGELVTGALGVLSSSGEYAAEEAQCRVFESSVAYLADDSPHAIRAAERALELERGREGPAGRERKALAQLALAYAAGGRFGAADRTYGELMALLEAQGLDHTNGAATDTCAASASASSLAPPNSSAFTTDCARTLPLNTSRCNEKVSVTSSVGLGSRAKAL